MSELEFDADIHVDTVVQDAEEKSQKEERLIIGEAFGEDLKPREEATADALTLDSTIKEEQSLAVQQRLKLTSDSKTLQQGSILGQQLTIVQRPSPGHRRKSTRTSIDQENKQTKASAALLHTRVKAWEGAKVLADKVTNNEQKHKLITLLKIHAEIRRRDAVLQAMHISILKERNACLKKLHNIEHYVNSVEEDQILRRGGYMIAGADDGNTTLAPQDFSVIQAVGNILGLHRRRGGGGVSSAGLLGRFGHRRPVGGSSGAAISAGLAANGNNERVKQQQQPSLRHPTSFVPPSKNNTNNMMATRNTTSLVTSTT